MKNTMRWQLTTSMLHGFIGSIQTAYGYAQDLNESLSNIRIVTQKSADDMANFAKQANEAAKTLSTTTTDYTDASLIYYQQGLNDQEVQARTDVTIKLANAAGESAEKASEQLTAIWNNFAEGSDNLEHYADVLVKLGASTASSSEEISTGVQKFAAVAGTVGLSYESAAAALATVTAKTRESADIVGTAFRTLFARIQGLQQGETLDDGTDLNKYSEALKVVGVDIKDTNGELKGMEQILNELGERWQTLGDDQKIALAETVAGVRQYTQLMALMNNWDFYKENLATAQGSAGALQEQADIYAESWEAARDRTRAAAEDIYDSIVNPDFFIGVDNVLTPLLSGIADVLDGLNGFPGLLSTISTLMFSAFGDKISGALRDFAGTANQMTGEASKGLRELQADAVAATKTLEIVRESSKATVTNRNWITTEQLQLQAIVNDKMGSLNELEQKYVKQKMSELALQRDINDQYTQAVEKLQEQFEAEKKALEFQPKNPEENQPLFGSRAKGALFSARKGTKDNLSAQDVSSMLGFNFTKDWAKQLNAQFKDSTELTNAFVTNLNKVVTQSAKLNVLKTAFNQAVEAERNASDGAVNYQKVIESLPEELRQFAQTMQLIDSQGNILYPMTDGAIDFEAELQSLDERINRFSEGLKRLGADPGKLENYIAKLRTLTDAEFDNEIRTGNLARQYGVLGDNLQKGQIHITDWANSVVHVGQVLSQVSMGINAIQNLGKIFTDEDLSTSERIVQTFTSLSMLLPILGAGYEALIGTKLLQVTVDETGLVITGKTLVAKAAEAISRKAVAAAATEEAKAAALANGIMLAQLGTILAVVGAVAILTAVIYNLSEAYNADANAAKLASEQAEQTAKRYSELNQEYSALKDSIEDYQEARDALGELTEGTEEYADALERANTYAQQLLEANPELWARVYRDQQGNLQFNDLEGYQQEKQRVAGNAQVESYRKQQLSNNADIQNQITQLARNITYVIRSNSASNNARDAVYNIPRELLEQVLGIVRENNGTLIQDDLVKLTNATSEQVNALLNNSDRIIALANQMDNVEQSNKALGEEINRAYLLANNENFQGLTNEQQTNVVSKLDDIWQAQRESLIKEATSQVDFDNAFARYMEDIGASSYKTSAFGDKATFYDEEGNEVLKDISRSDVIEYLAEQIARSMLMNQDSQQYQESTNRAQWIQSYGENAGEGVGNAVLGYDTTGSLDNSLLSPEARDNLLRQLEETGQNAVEILNTYGTQGGASFVEGLRSQLEAYDPIPYYEKRIEEAQSNIESISTILDTYQNDETPDEEQEEQLNKIAEKYQEINRAREEGLHEYLQVLRGVQEAEEQEAENNLRNKKREQEERIQDLRDEIQSLTEDNVPEVTIKPKLEELEDALHELENTDYEIKVHVDTDLDTDVDEAFGLAHEVDALRQYVTESLEITYDEAQKIIEAGYGAMLQNARETADSTIQLDRDTVNSFIDGKQAEIEADRQVKINQLEAEKQVLLAKQNSISQGIAALQQGLQAEDTGRQAAALATAAKFKAEADAKKVTVENEMTYVDQGNEQIDKDTTELMKALGILHEDNAKNAQQANKDAVASTNALARDTINLYNQMQRAVVAYSNAVAAAADGNASLNESGFSSVNSVSGVGVTGSKVTESTYSAGSGSHVLEDLSGNIEDWFDNHVGDDLDKGKEVLQVALDNMQAEQASINAQIGAVDAGIAALKSVNLSLDKAQAGAGLGSSKGGGGGKSGGSTKEPDTLDPLEESKEKEKDLEDRYHEITREIQDQESAIEDLNDAMDLAYGAKRLEKYDTKIKQLTKQADNYQQKLKEAEEYLGVDQTNLIKEFEGTGVEFTFKDNGEIANYKEVLKGILDDYKAFENEYNIFVDKYNAQTAAGQEALKDELEAWNKRKDAEDKDFEKRQEALKQYEDTLDVIQEMKDAYEEEMREIEATKLEKITYKVEVVLELKEARDQLRDFSEELAESFSDSLYNQLFGPNGGPGLNALRELQAQADMKVLPTLEEEYNSLVQRLNEANSYTSLEDLKQAFLDLEDNALDSAQALLDWVNTIDDIVPNALDSARERFDLFLDQLDHNSSIADTIKELYQLQGVTYKTQQGFERLQKTDQERLDTASAKAGLNKQWAERARDDLLASQSALDNLMAQYEPTEENPFPWESDPAYNTLKANRDAFLEEYRQAQEAMYESAQEAMEAAQDMYLRSVEKTVYDFGQALTDGIGLDLAQDKYDHYIEESERYMDKVNEAYNTAAWYNKLQNDIDNTNNSVMRERLKDLQEEIDIRRQNNTLSQYDLDILEAKYEVLQAQMALEDAQNNKNQLRLVRDRQGNWNYQYTADPNEVADKQQELLDKENEWYNLAKQQVTDVTGEIIDTWNECAEKIDEIYNDMSLSEEERQNQIDETRRYYAEKAKFLEEEKLNAIKDMNEAGNKSLFDMAVVAGDEVADLTGTTADEIKALVEESGMSMLELLLADNEQIKDIVGSNTELIDAFSNSYADELQNMTKNNADFEAYLDKTLDDASRNFDDFYHTVERVAKDSGTDLDNLDRQMDVLSDSTDTCRRRMEELHDPIWDLVDAAREGSEQYANMASAVLEVVNALAQLAGYSVSNVEQISGMQDNWYSGNTDYTGLLEYGLKKGYLDFASDDFEDLYGQLGNKVGSGLYDQYGVDMNTARDMFGSMNKGDELSWQASQEYSSEEEWRKAAEELLKHGSSFATGGYTGEFEDAKLAFLHQKELVLNEDDTQNILTAVNAIRQLTPEHIKSIESILDGKAIMGLSAIAAKLSTISVPENTETIEQDIHIEAVFPNVVDSNEILEAFESLPNDAVQYARRRRD